METLRNELQGTGVAVSICYPPDMDTPGYQREGVTKVWGGACVRVCLCVRACVRVWFAGSLRICCSWQSRPPCTPPPPPAARAQPVECLEVSGDDAVYPPDKVGEQTAPRTAHRAP